MANAQPIQPSRQVLDITGERYGRLVAREFVGIGDCGQARWLCVCDCGATVEVGSNSLRRKATRSCGCLNHEARWRHGMAYSLVYRRWMLMKSRCQPTARESRNYFDRGIRICERWIHSFAAFYEDMGDPPTARHSLDRYPNNDGNYEPGNCRWATRAEQNRNRRNNHLLTYNGETRTIADWAVVTGLTFALIAHRLKRGWSAEEALTIPSLKAGAKKPRSSRV